MRESLMAEGVSAEFWAQDIEQYAPSPSLFLKVPGFIPGFAFPASSEG